MSRPSNTKPPSSDGSAVPGETEEDGFLRQEYVVVDDKRALEINRAVDGAFNHGRPSTSVFNMGSPLEIHAARRKPLRDQKIPATLNEDHLRIQHSNGAAYTSSFNTPEAAAPISFPPPPNSNPPPLSSSPSSAGSRAGANALTRALNLASKKLFGSGSARSSPHYREYTSSSPRRQQFLSSKGAGLGLDVNGLSRDPMEDEILATLEELAQKTDVLTHWADEMYEYVKAVPQSRSIAYHRFVVLIESIRAASRSSQIYQAGGRRGTTCCAKKERRYPSRI